VLVQTIIASLTPLAHVEPRVLKGVSRHRARGVFDQIINLRCTFENHAAGRNQRPPQNPKIILGHEKSPFAFYETFSKLNYKFV